MPYTLIVMVYETMSCLGLPASWRLEETEVEDPPSTQVKSEKASIGKTNKFADKEKATALKIACWKAPVLAWYASQIFTELVSVCVTAIMAAFCGPPPLL